ncbi:CocE/NonD family hydrolase [Nocardia sp. FBN12]|uniref:CocE/NonD family hydrolase n=1 Tax=Nocardia sp. FBN12 TaxID=3419766 RepID=UPI003CFE34F6
MFRSPNPIAAAAAAFTAVAIAVAPMTFPPAMAQAGGADSAARWTETQDSAPAHPRVHTDSDVPITMSDGTVLKANVYRPADSSGQPIAETTPVIVNLTPYSKTATPVLDAMLNVPVLSDAVIDFFRTFDLSDIGLGGVTDLTKALPAGVLRAFAVDRRLVQSGYTQVVVDVRGTGYSQGTWQVFGEREQQDGVEVIDWAAAQPWSDGKVGMNGISYSAINQMQTAERRPDALKAIFPIVPGSDLIRDVAAPGGGLGVGFILPWVTGINSSKLAPSPDALFRGIDPQWLADRLADPFTFFNVLLNALATPDLTNPELATVLDGDGTLRQAWLGHPERVNIPTFVYGGWHDIFAYSSPRIYDAIDVPAAKKKLIMGDTYHFTTGSGLGLPGGPPRLDVLQRAWFDKWLKGIDNGIDRFDQVTSWQQGNGWVSTAQLPGAGMGHRRMYLNAAPSGTTATSVHDGSLTADPGASARLTVAPGLATLCSRDGATGTGGALALLDVCGKDSRISETTALTFTSAPVTGPTQISGPINLHLNTVLDATDGFWAATVNDVAPDGTSTVLTSGQLQASLRAVDEAKATRSANGDYTDPYPALSLDSRQPIVPGEPTTVDIGLTATDALLQPGHRLRVDVYSFNFPRGLPLGPFRIESELRPQHLNLDPAQPSWINIPTDGRANW